MYGIRNWIEQGYKQVKDELGWGRLPGPLRCRDPPPPGPGQLLVQRHEGRYRVTIRIVHRRVIRRRGPVPCGDIMSGRHEQVKAAGLLPVSFLAGCLQRR
jgi:hypothetical protein